MKSNQPDDILFDGDFYESQYIFEPPGPDVPFWVDLAREFGPKVLELACGTGRVTIPMCESGVSVDGVDFSESMLCVARRHAGEKSLAIRFMQGDLRSLPFNQEYNLMYLPTATLLHLLTRTDVEAFLLGVRRGLRSGGILALDMHNPMNVFLKSWPLDLTPTERSFVHRITGERITVNSTQDYRSDSQIFTVKNHYTFADGSTRNGEIVLRYYFPEELVDLLYYNGFETVKRFEGYTRKEFTAESERYVLLARPRG